MNKQTIASVLIISSTLASTTVHASEASVQDLIGKSWHYQQGKNQGTVYYGKKTAKLIIGGRTINGKLRIEGNKICTKFKAVRNGKEACFSVKKTAKGYKTSHGGILTKK